jgi:orotidine-5'-phosphate decarboxylase
MSRRKNDLSQRLEAVIKTLVPQQEQNPDDLGPMMRAIKAVHSISDHTSTTPEDLERQRAAEELFARLVTPGIGIRSDSLTVGGLKGRGHPGAAGRYQLAGRAFAGAAGPQKAAADFVDLAGSGGAGRL